MLCEIDAYKLGSLWEKSTIRIERNKKQTKNAWIYQKMDMRKGEMFKISVAKWAKRASSIQTRTLCALEDNNKNNKNKKTLEKSCLPGVSPFYWQFEP